MRNETRPEPANVESDEDWDLQFDRESDKSAVADPLPLRPIGMDG